MALKGKLSTVKELDFSDQPAQNVDQEKAICELQRQLDVLQGLLSIKEINERSFIDRIGELERKLKLTIENGRLLNVQHATVQKLTNQKEEAEQRLLERYAQVEELERQKSRADEEQQEHLGLLLSEITEQEDDYMNLEKANLMLLRQMGEMEKNIFHLDEKVGYLKKELEDRVFNEAAMQEQCLDMEQAVKDWQLLDREQKVNFKRLEHKLQCIILEQKTHLVEKDEILKGHLKFLAYSDNEDGVCAIGETNVCVRSPAEEPNLHEGQRGLDLEKNGSFIQEGALWRDINTSVEEVKELHKQVRLQEESQEELQDGNVMFESLLVNAERENSTLRDQIFERDNLLSIKGETEHTFQMQICNLEHLLSASQQELDCKQHELCDELNKWKIKCSNYEKQELQMESEIQNLKDLLNKKELEASQFKLSMSRKEKELTDCNLMKNKGLTYLTLDYNKTVVHLQNKMSSLQRENEKMNISLRNNTKKLELSGENLRNVMRDLKGKQHTLRRIESALQMSAKEIEAQLHKKVQFVTAATATLKQAQQLEDSKLIIKKYIDTVELSVQEQKVDPKHYRETMEEFGYPSGIAPLV
ncbi:hypothetical protein NDU88_001684 [Pleurodeles waltl]|uniref:Uncharacterized protein n=1 Tax=Pleurodeles waltl TaxID=8319 RepID=A0AAV7WM96_PLEWA|nr:hypothetical protein NDU88_001684 [Pleurodeles waltl]